MLTFSALVILSCMAANLDYGIRYAFPMMPFVCVWLGAPPPPPARPGRGAASW